MAQVNKCPVCGQSLKFIPKPGEPKRVWALCNHGNVGILAQPVMEMDKPETPEEPKERKAQDE